MKAYVTHAAVEAGVALSLEEMPRSEIADYEVLVEVKAMGATVTATSSGKNRDFVLDTVGPEVAQKSLEVLKPGGHLVTILASGKLDALQEKAQALGVSAKGFFVHSDGDDMNRLAAMLADGSLVANVHKAFPFAQMADAHREVELGRTVGKVVVTL